MQISANTEIVYILKISADTEDFWNENRYILFSVEIMK